MTTDSLNEGLITPDMEQNAASIARDRARNARWDLNIAIFLFAVLILVIILVTYTGAGPEVVAPVAAIGLVMVWVVGWRRGKQLYQTFYDEEIMKLEREIRQVARDSIRETIEETIEEQVQKALKERWKGK
jgi:Flp pilus assembly protein TadB